MRLTLERRDGGARCRLTEEQWTVAAALAGSDLPAWARPIEDVAAAGAPQADETDDAPVAPDPLELDDALSEAIGLGSSAIVEIEVAAVAGERGVLALLRCDGAVGSALVRGVEVRTTDGTGALRLRPGVEVSGFPVGRLVDETLRLAPPAPVHVRAEPADVPQELAVALATALRRGDGRLLAALLAELGLEEPPAVLEQLVRTTDGRLDLSTRSAGRDDVSVAGWMRCAAGWVELSPGPDGTVRHTPRTPEDIARTLLVDLTGRFDAALAAAREGDGS